MDKKLLDIKQKLDFWVDKRNSKNELNIHATPDPLQVAKIYKNEFVSLVCALFAYGNAKNIVKFLSSIDFDILNSNPKIITSSLQNKIYRFQNTKDITEFFISLHVIKQQHSLQNIFKSGFDKHQNIMDGINALIDLIYSVNPYRSRGYEFLIGKPYTKNSTSTYKRWNMYLRWMVRKDELDFGLWDNKYSPYLLAPLDTHTHKMALSLGLIQRKSYDFKAVCELTCTLLKFDKFDPIKYDFALYRLGQEKIQI